jgi:hypothetical protein
LRTGQLCAANAFAPCERGVVGQPGEVVRSLKVYLCTVTARLSFNRLRDQQARRKA